MAISPMDIHNKEFSTVRVGGYNKEEVDAFLDLVADELDRLIRRYQEQSMMVEDLKQKLARFEEMQQTLQNAIINAQRSADQIVEEAKAQAQALLREAQEQKARLAADAQAERERILAVYSGLKEQVFSYLSTVRELLDRNRAMLSEYEARLMSREPKDTGAAFIPSPPEEFMGEKAVPTEAPATPEAPSIIAEPEGTRPPLGEPKPTGEVRPKIEPGPAEEPLIQRPQTLPAEEPVGKDVEPDFLITPERKAQEKEEKEEKHFFWE